MKNKIIAIFILFITISHSQNNKHPLLDFTIRSDTLMLAELEVNSTFIKNINAILFNANCNWLDNNTFSSYQYFGIKFYKKDSVNYNIYIELYKSPSNESIGIIKQNKYFYCLIGDIPNNLILKIKPKKKIVFTRYPPHFVNPPSWTLIYNVETEEICIKEQYCY